MERFEIKHLSVWKDFKKYLLDEFGFVYAKGIPKYNLGYFIHPIFDMYVGAENINKGYVVVEANGNLEMIRSIYNCFIEKLKD